MCPAVYWTSFKRNNPPIVTFPLVVPWPERERRRGEKADSQPPYFCFWPWTAHKHSFYFTNRAPLVTEAFSQRQPRRLEHRASNTGSLEEEEEDEEEEEEDEEEEEKDTQVTKFSTPLKKVEVLTFLVNCFESLSSCSSP